MTLAWVLIDRYGRRVLLTSGAGIMAGSFMFLTLFAALAQRFEGAAQLRIFTEDLSTMSGDIKQMAMSVLGIVTLYFITSVFGITWLATPMLIPTEIFPITARAQGSAISIVVWGLSNFGITLLTPILFNNISYWLFFIFGLTNLFAGVWTWIYLPETGGRSFEDNQAFFESAWDEKSWIVRKVDKEFLDMPKNSPSDDENESANEQSPLLRT